MIGRYKIRMQAYEIRLNSYNEAVALKDNMKKAIDDYEEDSVPCELVNSYFNQLEKVGKLEGKLKKIEEKLKK